jgi:hypothetical protein
MGCGDDVVPVQQPTLLCSQSERTAKGEHEQQDSIEFGDATYDGIKASKNRQGDDSLSQPLCERFVDLSYDGAVISGQAMDGTLEANCCLEHERGTVSQSPGVQGGKIQQGKQNEERPTAL